MRRLLSLFLTLALTMSVLFSNLLIPGLCLADGNPFPLSKTEFLNVAEFLESDKAPAEATEETLLALAVCKGWINGFVDGNNMYDLYGKGPKTVIIALDANRIISGAAYVLSESTNDDVKTALITAIHALADMRDNK